MGYCSALTAIALAVAPSLLPAQPSYLGLTVKDVGIASGIGVGTGGRLSGITVAGLGAGAGGGVDGLTIAGLGVGSGGRVRGISIAGLGVGSGGGVTGLNIAENLRGVQIGLLNIARDNPRGRRVLRIVNWGVRD